MLEIYKYTGHKSDAGHQKSPPHLRCFYGVVVSPQSITSLMFRGHALNKYISLLLHNYVHRYHGDIVVRRTCKPVLYRNRLLVCKSSTDTVRLCTCVRSFLDSLAARVVHLDHSHFHQVKLKPVQQMTYALRHRVNKCVHVCE